ncbi:hypothetical protein B9G39_04875 [Zooshikella ganghwensis]|uniref:Uncharacterized protein n=1 Tax=Zooshikella ganghwensis TaxID=202772 RepID=A0A4P9VKL6_9GAMM|nr:hypothetical protein B9G39_04875 [Zooshikella ganghwensis]
MAFYLETSESGDYDFIQVPTQVYMAMNSCIIMPVINSSGQQVTHKCNGWIHCGDYGVWKK